MLFLIHLLGGFYCATKLSILKDDELVRLLLCVVLGWVFIVFYVFTYNTSSSGITGNTTSTKINDFVKNGNITNNNESNKHSSVVTKKNETIEQKSYEYSNEKVKTNNINASKSQNNNLFEGAVLNSIYASVAGVTYNGRQKYVQQCYTGQHLKVVRDVFNAYDNNAIALYANENQVGFVKKELAAQLSKKIDNGIKFDCIVENVTGGNNNYYGLNVKLYEIKNNKDNDIGKVYHNEASNSQKIQNNYHVSENYDDFDEEDEENLDEVWTARDFNEYYTGDRDNDNWEYPDN